MGEQTDPSQPESPEAEAKRGLVDTLAEQQALAALDELIAKVDSGSELSAAVTGPQAVPPVQEDQYPAEAYGRTGDVPPFDGWYVAMKDNAQGPFTVDELKDRWSSGDILPDSLCWREGMGEWRPLSRLHGLAAAVAPRPREGLKALSAKPPTRAVSQPSGFAPVASNMLRSLAEQEAKSERPAKPAEEVPTSPRPPTAPTTLDGPKRVPPPAVKPPAFSVEARAPELDDDDEPEKRPAGVSGAKLFFSLFTASVLGGLVGGGLVKMTIPPPPEPVVVHEPEPPSPPPAPVAAPTPPPPPAEPPKVEPRVEPKAELKPRVARPPAEANPDAPPLKPRKSNTNALPPPTNKLDKDFQDTFGK